MIGLREGPVLTNQLTFVAYGHPAPQGSKRYVGKSASGRGVMVEMSKRVDTWRDDVKLAALRALDGNPTWDRSCRIVTAQITFVFPRPRSHYRTGKLSHLLRDDAPHLHTKKPDLDKLLRSTGDALTAAGVFPDDCCLARVSATKVYATEGGIAGVAEDELDRPGAWITLWTGVDE